MEKILKPKNITYILSSIIFILFSTFFILKKSIILYLALIVGLPLIIYITYSFFKHQSYFIPALIITSSLENIHLSQLRLFPISLFHVTFFAFLGFFILKKLYDKDLSINIPDKFGYLFIFLFIMTFSIIYSPNRLDALLYITRFFFLLLMSIFIANIEITKRELYIILILWALNILILSGYNLYLFKQVPLAKFVSEKLNPFNPATRIKGVFESVNKFAIFLSSFNIVGFSIILVSKIKLKYKLMILTILAIISAAILTTFTRSVFLISFISIFIIYFFTPYKKLYHITAITGLIALIILYFTNDFVQSYINRFLILISSGRVDYSASTRINLLIGAYNIGTDHLLTGVGLRGFPHYYNGFYMPHSHSLWEVIICHNIFGLYFAELGILGLIALILYFFQYFLFHLKKINKINDPLLKSIYLGILLSVFQYFLFFQFEPSNFTINFFWIFTGLSYTILSYINKLNSKNNV